MEKIFLSVSLKPWKHGGRLCLYLEGDAGSVLDLKRHFLPVHGDLSGVERPCGERARGGGGGMSEWTDGSMEPRVFFVLLTLLNISEAETHPCLLHSSPMNLLGEEPDDQSWEETRGVGGQGKEENGGEDHVPLNNPQLVDDSLLRVWAQLGIER